MKPLAARVEILLGAAFGMFMTLTDGSAAVAIDGDGEGVEVAGARTVDEFLDLALDRLRSGFERASPTD